MLWSVTSMNITASERGASSLSWQLLEEVASRVMRWPAEDVAFSWSKAQAACGRLQSWLARPAFSDLVGQCMEQRKEGRLRQRHTGD